jgi:hypothetical protein
VRRGITLVAAALAACSSKAPVSAPDAGSFAAVGPAVYVAKVKNVLTGLPPTDVEVRAVQAKPAALGDLVDGWMRQPEYDRKMLRFFQLAFQQTQIISNDFLDQVYAQVGLNDSTTPRLLQNVQESFARTMLALTAAGRPLTEAMTTRQYMMTTATKELYAFLDTVDISNDGLIFDRFRAANRSIAITIGAAQGPIPLAESLDPNSPNFMRWYDPDVATAYADLPACKADPIVLGPVAISMHYLFLGTIDSRKLADGTLCPRINGSAQAPQFTAHDFEDWTMVTVRPPKDGEATTPFYDLAALRAAKELVLVVPRLGFFSTPAFFANWPTNVSNQMRATVHQALIVATGSAIDGTDETQPPATPGLDATHSNQGACLACHRTLDPTRSIFARTWSWHYRRQQDPAFLAEPGLFAFGGVVTPVNDLADFGAALAAHPLVAPGWVQKLCYYVNSAPCDPADPEYRRLVELFRSSKYSWGTLVKALVTSPIVTHAAPTATGRGNGEVVAVARRDHLCAALEARLGIADVCGLRSGVANALSLIVSGLPSDAYARGATAPVLPNDPTLFFRAGMENICTGVATQVIDAPATAGARGWSSAAPDAAIHDFVGVVMALPPGDPRAAEAEALLKNHFAQARQQPGVGATEALQSTFIAACLAPGAVSVGL